MTARKTTQQKLPRNSPSKNLKQDVPPSICAEAEEIIYGDREQTYGSPDKNLQQIASYWSAHLDVDVTIDDVCIMMMLLKLARLKTTPEHRDSKVDLCGYAALMDRCQQLED